MKIVHVECQPDEALVKKLGFARKSVIHHAGKLRVFRQMQLGKNQLALIDEDPGSAKTIYEQKLQSVGVSQGVKLYSDKSGNKILVLQGKLEDWIVATCKKARIQMVTFGLPNKPNDLHSVINQRIGKFEDLIDHLLKSKNGAIKQLKDWLS